WTVLRQGRHRAEVLPRMRPADNAVLVLPTRARRHGLLHREQSSPLCQPQHGLAARPTFVPLLQVAAPPDA
ncbi:MAG: hypothetical protein UV42_C0050G0001, partial [Candidatus Magasanikbacteria bacterium GW2011_GWE2_42_7]